MNKQALVGVFTLIGIALLFGVFYILADFGVKAGGYRIGVHFESAAGLRPGALTYLSGVPVGTVDQIVLEPDYTVDVIVAVKRTVDIPASSKFIISVPLTGEPTLLIVPPRKPDASLALLPKAVLPLTDQPQGSNPATIEDLLEEGQGEVHKVDQLLTAMTQEAPSLMTTLNSTLQNANLLTVKANHAFDAFTANSQVAAGQLQHTLAHVSANFSDMSETLDTTVKRNSGRIDTLIASLSEASKGLAATIDSMRQLAADPRVHENFVATTQSLANTTAALAGIASDMRQVTSNPQTQAQLRDTVASLDASTQRLSSLLGTFGGHSNVYGVDAGATPAPVPPPGVSPAPNTAPVPAGTALPIMRSPQQRFFPSSGSASGSSPAALRLRLGAVAKNLLAVEIRVSELSRQTVPIATQGNGSPLLTHDRGPQSDFNLHLLPGGDTSFVMGANDLGAQTSYNFYGLTRMGPLHVGGGILYSRLGLLARAQSGHLGFETQVYDPRNLTLDAYGKIILAPRLNLFGGQRDVLHPDRRTVFGIEATVP
jgi:phospholipid/cholesterol/gamma-HCH transport system substrate-binding protein